MSEELVLRSGGATCSVLPYAAHVTRFSVDGTPVLFLSREAVVDSPPKAIRGGIPIIWPQFSNRGPLSSHGFARNKRWTVVKQDAASATLELQDDEETRKVYPGFRIRYSVEVTPSALKLAFTAEPKDKPLEFTFALHSYFAAKAIAGVQVLGLQGCSYQNHLKDMAVEKEERAAIEFAEETDRTYLNVPRELTIVTGKSSKVVLRTSTHLPDAVVWNPWIEKSKRMGDFGDDEYKQMVCVEVGAVAKPIQVPVGQSWTATHEIEVVEGSSKL